MTEKFSFFHQNSELMRDMAVASYTSSSSSSVNSPFVLPWDELIDGGHEEISSKMRDANLIKGEVDDLQNPVPADRNRVKRASVDPWKEDIVGWGLLDLNKKMDEEEAGGSKKLKREEHRVVIKEHEYYPFDFLENKEHAEKFQRYEADMKTDKYFSHKTPAGDNVYIQKAGIDGDADVYWKDPPYQFYLVPAIGEAFKERKPALLAGTSSAAKKKKYPNPNPNPNY